jgi:hypothetical protein
VTTLGELNTLLEVAPGAGQSAQVRGWARWQAEPDPAAAKTIPPSEQVELRAAVDEQSVLARLQLASDRRELLAFNELVSGSAGSGFRRRLAEVSAETPGSVLTLQLLDDLPILLRVAGQAGILEHPAIQRRALHSAPLPDGSHIPGSDQCEGWRSDGTLVKKIISSGGNLTMSLAAPVPAESAMWPACETLPAMTTRRRRRVLLRNPETPRGPIGVQMYFRDSYADPDGIERGLHSYQVQAELAADGVIQKIDANGLILPWPECWSAAASAAGLRDVAVDEIPLRAKGQLLGRGTCTHLTDTLRGFEQVAVLAGLDVQRGTTETSQQ